MPDFLPRRTADLLTWSANFDRTLAADPARFGLTPADAAAYAEAHAAFAAAYGTAADPLTRSPANILAKDEAEAALKRAARMLAGQARSYSRGNRAAQSALATLGLRAGGARRRRIARPADAPVLFIDWPRGHTVPLRLADASSPSRRGKPPGVSGATVFTFVGEEPPGNDGPGWVYRTHTGRARLTIDFPASLPPGTKVWITACWFNPRGEASPYARPIHAHLGAAVPTFARTGSSLERLAA